MWTWFLSVQDEVKWRNVVNTAMNWRVLGDRKYAIELSNRHLLKEDPLS